MAQAFSITHFFLAHKNCRTPWMRDQIITRPLLRTKQHIKTRAKHPCPKWDSNPQSQQPGGQDLRLRLHSHRDQHKQDLHWLLKWLTACIHFGRDLWPQFHCATSIMVVEVGLIPHPQHSHLLWSLHGMNPTTVLCTRMTCEKKKKA